MAECVVALVALTRYISSFPRAISKLTALVADHFAVAFVLFRILQHVLAEAPLIALRLCVVPVDGAFVLRSLLTLLAYQ